MAGPKAVMEQMMSARDPATPIFVHAMWRTGSTYIWNKFRQQTLYRAYLEPLHEDLIAARTEQLNALHETGITEKLRHPRLDAGYFAEYPFRPEGGVPYFQKHFSYEKYCLDEHDHDDLLKAYIQNLISLATQEGKTPVLQFNRSLLRVGWLTENFHPINVLLLRRPGDIWRSYLSFDDLYFPTMTMLIIGQNRAHEPLNYLAERFQAPEFRAEKVHEESDVYRRFTRERIADLYPLFFQFYAWTSVQALRYADAVIDMTGVSADAQLRSRTMEQLERLSIRLPLQDCNLPTYDCTAQERSRRDAEEDAALLDLRAHSPRGAQLRREQFDRLARCMSQETQRMLLPFVIE